MRRVGEVLARELGWIAERLALELARFAEEARAEGIVADVAPALGAQPAGCAAAGRDRA